MDDAPTFGAYLAARQGGLLRVAWLLTGDRQLAEDLVQTAMVKLWPRWDRVCAGGDPDAYVRRTLFTTYASWRRRRWRAEVPTEVVPDRQPAPDAFAEADLRQALAQLLPVLPARQRAVLVLRYYEDLTEAQVADVLGVSVGTVKSQAAKALARLRSSADLRARVEDAR